MANKPIAMNKLKQIIRLYTEGASKLKISQRIGVSRKLGQSEEEWEKELKEHKEGQK